MKTQDTGNFEDEFEDGEYEDDGRVIADMSAVVHPSPFGMRSTSRTQPASSMERPAMKQPSHTNASEVAGTSSTPGFLETPKTKLTAKERFWMILGALTAGLSISLVYIVFLALIIGTLFAVWNTLQS